MPFVKGWRSWPMLAWFFFSTDPPTVEWLLEHRQRLHGRRARTRGDTPLASLYKMYEYLVIGYNTGLRSEVEYFFNHSTWSVSAIPDPQDANPERYAILAGLPHYLVSAFNRLIERGLPRGSPAIITSAEEERRLRDQELKLEAEPEWATRVPRLPTTLVIPTAQGRKPEDASRSQRLLDLNVILEEPNVLFV